MIKFASDSSHAHRLTSTMRTFLTRLTHQVSAVVIGFDLHFNYKKLAQAHCYLRENKDCRYFATNTDATYPADGRLFPGMLER